jgi:hypothetical protein
MGKVSLLLLLSLATVHGEQVVLRGVGTVMASAGAKEMH